MVVIGTSYARKQKNAVMVRIPAKYGIEVAQNFYIILEEDSLRLIPEKNSTHLMPYIYS